jgi:predicted ATPase/DNA-binding winged helix-turn-helix (wHTH) protein
MMSSDALEIGSFLLDRERLELRRDGVKLSLGARACRILQALAERPGEILSADELRAAAWPGLQVEDVNLRVQIAALRKILGRGFNGAEVISTIPREGYIFIPPTAASADARPASGSSHSLPRSIAPLIGRARELDDLQSLLTSHRTVTITGAGGIGKTSLAIAAARQSVADSGMECVFVDLAVPMTSEQVPGSVYAALELETGGQDLSATIVRALQNRRMLIVLDNCEHVIEGAAAMALALTRGTDGVNVVATSRERLEVPGEQVLLLGPLGCAPAGPRLAASEAYSYASIELFAASATSRGQPFSIHDGNATQVGEICRRLDGIPLAIQLAAASCAVMTVGELARGLDDRFALLTRGERTALARHRTLEAALDWGHALLGDLEAIIFRRLALFRSWFTMADALVVVGGEGESPSALYDAMASLVGKSMLVADTEREPAGFRYLESTRAYALLRLEQAGEVALVTERHARSTLDRLRAAADIHDLAEPLLVFREIVDDWRGAHDHALATRQWELALRLLHYARPLCASLQISWEFATRAEQSFAFCDGSLDEEVARLELETRGFFIQLVAGTAALDLAIVYDCLNRSATRALELAVRLGDLPQRFQALWGLFYAAAGQSDTPALRRRAAQFHEAAVGAGGPDALRSAHRLRASAEYWSGNFAGAIAAADEALADTAPFDAPHSGRGFAQVPAVLTIRARAYWGVGEFDAGLADAAEARRVAITVGDAPTLYYVLVTCALPISLWSGDFEGAEAVLEEIEKLAVEHSNPSYSRDLRYWRAAYTTLGEYGGSYGGAAIAWDPPAPWQADNQSSIHCAYHRTEDLSRAGGRLDHWCGAEHCRSAGEQLLAAGIGGEARPEELFRQALAIASTQGAAAWEIRARVSLARLYLATQRATEAKNILAPVLARWGADSPNSDVRIAWALR